MTDLQAFLLTKLSACFVKIRFTNVKKSVILKTL